MEDAHSLAATAGDTQVPSIHDPFPIASKANGRMRNILFDYLC